MTITIRHLVSALLVLSFGLLGSLIPGGSIETRSFSHIDPLILGAFNTFLTSLEIVSLLIIYFIFKDLKWAFIVSSLCAMSYFIVYALDLGTLFPVSPDPMPQALFVIEVLGMIVSLPLLFLSVRGAMTSNTSGKEQVIESKPYSKTFVYFAFFLVIVGVGIITFATKSAIGS
ncbi:MULTISPECIES: hypothetical protein [Moorena]|uniref:DUF8051 domain-containing protein n=3 Tax=Moorena TaxID=1155738 RepID=A0A1D9G0H1_MOOP1|nr:MULTISPECIES: hypothetical protein [Moorena]NEQ10260.1 hypothetical protein [Moorena sp. SIO4E2]NEQ14008.1 hypothetical protein [Moorena sp. SIO3E2]AOY81093.1 hypothetical protein BJP36_15490 [Moorena producens JHB]EGJ34711.1 hypothetical protein LYNGBM3L_13490 [Moorena producens 3L]NEP34692.1 hypothetical protein [Moorena sp. SIO3B2]